MRKKYFILYYFISDSKELDFQTNLGFSSTHPVYSPDGTTVASLRADETWAFWDIFTPGRQQSYSLLTRPTFGMPSIR